MRIKPRIVCDVNVTRPTEITITAEMDDALRIVANLSRIEMVTVEMDTTGVGLPFYQTLQDEGVKVRKIK